MKPSEAIRSGSQLVSYQCQRAYQDGQGGYCLIGMAMLAGGVKDGRIADFDALFGDISTERVTCPVTGEHNHPLAGMLVELNDDYQWTPDQAAQWLEEQGL